MIWLASYPRSGNTFFRNILFDVYGISSGDYHTGEDKAVEDDFSDHKIVKTHLLPDQLPQDLQSCASIYLIRDGRDSAVSLAHHRINIKKTKGSYLKNLLEIIFGIGGSFKGGWSGHVKTWTGRSAIIIKYEELIADPIGQMERLRSIMDLPQPHIDRLPTFSSQKKGLPKYGSGKKQLETQEQQQARAQQFYRRGIAGAYKDEMPTFAQFLFWLLHRKQLKKFEYE